MIPEAELIARGHSLAAALRALIEDYPADDPDVTPTIRLTLTRQGTELDHLELPPDTVEHLIALTHGELDTFRNAHHDQSGACGHCRGTGQAIPSSEVN